MALKPEKVTGLDVAFGGDMERLLPAWDSIPDEFKRHGGTKWNKLVSDWFFAGLTEFKPTPKPGIDANEALAHVKAVMVSFDPSHEHKEAGCAYLLSEFFEDATWTAKPLTILGA